MSAVRPFDEDPRAIRSSRSAAYSDMNEIDEEETPAGDTGPEALPPSLRQESVIRMNTMAAIADDGQRRSGKRSPTMTNGKKKKGGFRSMFSTSQ